MATAVVIQIADAVAAALAGATLSQTFAVERAYIPAADLADLGSLRITVVPQSLAMTPLSRGSDEFDYAVDVGIQKRVDTAAASEDQVVAAVDPLMGFVEEVVDFFRGQAAADFGPARFVGLENAPVYDPAHLFEKQVFTSVVTLRFKKARAK